MRPPWLDKSWSRESDRWDSQGETQGPEHTESHRPGEDTGSILNTQRDLRERWRGLACTQMTILQGRMWYTVEKHKIFKKAEEMSYFRLRRARKASRSWGEVKWEEANIPNEGKSVNMIIMGSICGFVHPVTYRPTFALFPIQWWLKSSPVPVFSEFKVPASWRKEIRLVLIPVKPLRFWAYLLLQHSTARLWPPVLNEVLIIYQLLWCLSHTSPWHDDILSAWDSSISKFSSHLHGHLLATVIVPHNGLLSERKKWKPKIQKIHAKMSSPPKDQ